MVESDESKGSAMVEVRGLPARVGRRGLILGAGAGSLVAGSVALPAVIDSAEANGGDGTEGVTSPRDGSPIATSIASAPQTGLVYRSVMMYDFFPFNPASQKTWGGFGTYSAVSATSMRASLEIPPGAVVADVEYYIYNSSGGTVVPDTYISVPGQGTISSIGASGVVPSTGSVTATRVVVPDTTHGPYPSGTRLLVSLSTPATGTVQLNGARVGFRHGDATLGLLQHPARVFHGKLTKGRTHVVTLPATLRAAGTVGVQVNLLAQSARKAGGVTVWSPGSPRPSEPLIFFPKGGAGVANAATVPVSAAGTFLLRSSQTVHLTVVALSTVS